MSETLREALELIAEMAPDYHFHGLVRDHADPTDKTGWNVKGIETCADPLCVEALRLAALAAPPVPAGDERERLAALLREQNIGIVALVAPRDSDAYWSEFAERLLAAGVRLTEGGNR